VLQHIAQWNPTTQLWETDQIDLFSGHSEPYSETFPTSGMTLAGRLLPLPQSGHPIGGNGSSSLELLHTPDTMPDAPNKGSNTKSKPAGLGNQVIEIALLPTPDTGMSPNGHGRRGGKPGNGSQSGASLDATVTLLPSPVAQQSGSSPEEHLRRKPGRKQVTDLAIIVENGLM
jgi:hypothetical protein